MTRPLKPRSSLSAGMYWASRISTVGLMFVLPSLIGVLLDRWANTTPYFILAGSVSGFFVGMMGILQIAREGRHH